MNLVRRLSPFASHQFIRFLTVGVLNSLFGYGCYVVLLHAGVGYGLALLFATIAGVLLNFKTTGTLVFQSHNNMLIWRFALVYALLYVVNFLIVKVLVGSGLTPSVAGVLALPGVALLSFLLNRRLVFKNV